MPDVHEAIPAGGLVIQTARKHRGYTQDELAAQYGISRNTLVNYETGKTEPSFLMVFEILKMMNYSIEEIYDYANGRRH
ncbi:helix-turn-helix transcriptional regulator [Glaciecola sp. 2405UD65-10]|uniref:helix-turn-helix transcriptional regulator n=1 Tax=Glaciecola sp. 2405UD65-10 TaxID=3397244 RepID=UPI003B5C529D